jgi:hypothetical protein
MPVFLQHPPRHNTHSRTFPTSCLTLLSACTYLYHLSISAYINARIAQPGGRSSMLDSSAHPHGASTRCLPCRYRTRLVKLVRETRARYTRKPLSLLVAPRILTTIRVVAAAVNVIAGALGASAVVSVSEHEIEATTPLPTTQHLGFTSSTGALHGSLGDICVVEATTAPFLPCGCGHESVRLRRLWTVVSTVYIHE